MDKVTTADIARMAGVSPSAVSIALNGKPGISEKTRARILRVVRESGYLQSAPGRFTSAGSNIAVLFRNEFTLQDRLFYIELNTSIMETCENLPLNLVFAYTYYRNGRLTFSDVLRSDLIDGILAYGDIDRLICAELKALNLPIVVLDSSRREEDFYLSVQVDYEHAAYAATRHLIDLGHRDIALIGNNKLQDFNLLIFEGFQRATAEANLALGTKRIQLSVNDEASLDACVEDTLSGAQPPTAFVCATDYYAMRTLARLRSNGIRVPQDISVIGIDDLVCSKHLAPALTTMAVDRREMGQLGLELIQRAIRGEPCSSVTLPRCRLIVRESTAAPRE